MTQTLTYLALGDSYTVGEGVPLPGSFPYQAVQLLRLAGHAFTAPDIVAITGWTTDELHNAIGQTALLPAYDRVSLLIGVNNQYRNRTVEDYIPEFTRLLQKAIAFAHNEPRHVFVLSIPDWGVTPFAADGDRPAIARAIDAYNTANKALSEQYGVTYIDITTEQRIHGHQSAYLASDGLHPSAKEYANWAMQLSRAIIKSITY